MYSRKLGIAIIGIILVALLSFNAISIGISPSKKVVDYKSNTKESITIKVINNEQKNFKAFITTMGELEDYITINQNVVELKSYEESKSFTYTIDFPEEMEKPGPHSSQIVAMEVPTNIPLDEEKVVVTATSAIISQLIVNVPYPGKYVESKLVITPANAGENIRFVLPTFNYGEQPILRAKALIEIFGATNEKVGETETNEIRIDPQGEGKLEASWTASVNPGIYKAVATLTYDEKTIRLEDTFYVGDLLIEIERIEVKDFTLGEIAKFKIYLQSRWNKHIENIHGEITMTDEKGTVYGNIKTYSVDLEPMAKAIIDAYWDTKGVEIGTYEMKVVIHYGERSTEKIVNTHVNLNSITIDLEPVGYVVMSEKKDTVKDIMIYSMIFVLILINIGWFIYFKKSQKKKK